MAIRNYSRLAGLDNDAPLYRGVLNADRPCWFFSPPFNFIAVFINKNNILRFSTFISCFYAQTTLFHNRCAKNLLFFKLTVFFCHFVPFLFNDFGMAACLSHYPIFKKTWVRLKTVHCLTLSHFFIYCKCMHKAFVLFHSTSVHFRVIYCKPIFLPFHKGQSIKNVHTEGRGGDSKPMRTVLH